MELLDTILLNGTVQSLIYQNEESGYTVLRLYSPETSMEITAVGCMPFVTRGETVELKGTWTTHASYGEQFLVSEFSRVYPGNEAEITSFLSGGAVKGIGPKTAENIVKRFGNDSLLIIATDPEALTKVKGITLEKAKRIREDFNRRASLSALTDFILANSLPLYIAFRLYRHFGDFAMDELKKNPYLICGPLFGEDFGSAERLAASLGIYGDDAVRVDAGILYELYFNLQNGHTFIPREKLAAAVCGLLGVEGESVEYGVRRLEESGEIVIEEICREEAVYLSEIRNAECRVASKIRELSREYAARGASAERAVERVEEKTGIRYANAQKDALYACARYGVTVLTGGPGTGKTTAVRGMLELYDILKIETFLCAPTGRAAKRLSELCQKEASTVHRLLEAGYGQRDGQTSFMRNENNTLQCGAVIVDEASMLDVFLADALLSAVKPGTRLIFVGDADQLPSVGPGNFLRDLIASGLSPVIKLGEIFRQVKTSEIILNAHRINRGELPDLDKNCGDFFFINRRSPAGLSDTVSELCSGRITEAFGIAGGDIQVICPSRIGSSGTVAINASLQEVMNPQESGKAEVRVGNFTLREGDRVLQTRNNYDLLWHRVGSNEIGTGIYNGDIGKIVKIDIRFQTAT
ncbi:MAG: AAA family ATPase, partial [Bacillota bacterium]|nr:AAA family ATPase [Bacillota bacterium]